LLPLGVDGRSRAQDSAGGLATYWHADRFASALPKAFVAAVPDSGFFIGDVTKPEWPASLQWIVQAMNSTRGLDASCVAAAARQRLPPGEACTLPEDVAPYISVPLFVMNSMYDPAMLSISSKCKSPSEINALAARFVHKVKASVLLAKKPGRNGAFITACHEHCGQWAQGQDSSVSPADFNATIDGTTAPFAVQAWFRANRQGQAEKPIVHMATAVYPCANCCSGGDGP
jgi:hypothetical protein